MTMDEYVSEISFLLGIPANENVEGLSVKQAVLIAFREIKRYIKTPTDKTVPYSTRIDLIKNDIHTYKVLAVYASRPRIGMTLNNISSGNVFQIAAAVNVYSAVGNTSTINIDPIVTELGMAQVRNTLSTDFQWKYDISNQCVYCAHRDPRPTAVTVRYVPDYQDVSEIVNPTYVDYIVRMATANMKLAQGRARSKYKVSDSPVELDGDILLQEANSELEKIREELEAKRNKFIILN